MSAKPSNRRGREVQVYSQMPFHLSFLSGDICSPLWESGNVAFQPHLFESEGGERVAGREVSVHTAEEAPFSLSPLFGAWSGLSDVLCALRSTEEKNKSFLSSEYL